MFQQTLLEKLSCFVENCFNPPAPREKNEKKSLTCAEQSLHPVQTVVSSGVAFSCSDSGTIFICTNLQILNINQD